jgi:hypothetical protein
MVDRAEFRDNNCHTLSSSVLTSHHPRLARLEILPWKTLCEQAETFAL